MNFFRHRRWLKLIQFGLGVVLALTPSLLSPVCKTLMKNGEPMPCHYSGLLITVLALLIAGFNLLSFLLPRKHLVWLADLLSLLLLSLAYFLPSGILQLPFTGNLHFGLCKNTGMPCHQSFHLTTILIVFMAVIALVDIIILFIGQEDNSI